MKKYEGYALITGGSSGLGLEFAKQLGELGYNLVLVARDDKKLESARKLLTKSYDIDVVSITQDLTHPDSTDIIHGILQKKKIHVGLLVNNAGTATTHSFHKTPRNITLDMVKVSCQSVTDLTQKFLPGMLAKGSGGIIFLSSPVARLPGPFSAVYAACKAFELHLAVSLHAEYSNTGIDILALSPGITDTNLYHRGELLVPPKAKFLQPSVVVKKALDSLGKKIEVVVPNDMPLRIGTFMAGILPRKLMEKISLKVVKGMWKLD